MSYEISNNEASIKFQGESGETLIMKWAVKEIAVIKGNTIRVSTGNCDSSIIFRHQDVSSPVTVSATALVSIMNGWLAEYSPPPGSGE